MNDRLFILFVAVLIKTARYLASQLELEFKNAIEGLRKEK